MILVLTAAFIMAVPTTVTASSEQVSHATGYYSLSATTAEPFPMDVKSLTTAASKSWGITLDLDGKKYGLTLSEVNFLADGHVGQSAALSARCYRGYSSDGLSAIRATITPSWVHFSFTLGEKPYVLDPLGTSGGIYCVSEAFPTPETAVIANDEKCLLADGSARSVAVSQDCGNGSGSPLSKAESLEVGILGTAPSASSEDTRVKDNKSGKCALGDPVYRVADIICASDHEYRDLYPTDWQNRIISTVNDLNEKYEAQVGITFRICLFHAIDQNWPGDAQTTSDLVEDFMDYMNANNSLNWLPRDVNHLWTGKDIIDPDGHTPGAAYVAGVRRNVWDMVQNVAYGYSEQWHSSSDNLFYIGHEIGHNFNGVSQYHSHVEWVYPFYFSTWMGHEEFPFQAGWVLEFSEANKERIRSWASQALDEIRTTNPGYSIQYDGLQCSNIYIQLWDWGAEALSVHEVGKDMFVGFALANLNAFTLNLEMVFVVARDASGANRDFGHISNVNLGPGEVYYYHSQVPWVPTSGGSWDMWPGYELYGRWGPDQWLVMEPTFYYSLADEWHGIESSSANVDLWYNFELLSFTPTVGTGSTITVFCTMYNGIQGTGYTTFTYFFIAARGNFQIRDFGHSGQKSLAMDCSTADPTGAGCSLLVSRTIDVSGTWTFWPCYKLNGVYGPNPSGDWPGFTITV